MKTIDCALLDQIAGGRGNNGGDRVDNGGRNNNRGNGRGAPRTAANDAAVIGLLTAGAAIAPRFGPYGIVAAGILGGMAGVMGYTDNSQNNSGRDRGAFGGNDNPNSVNGQCRW